MVGWSATRPLDKLKFSANQDSLENPGGASNLRPTAVASTRIKSKNYK